MLPKIEPLKTGITNNLNSYYFIWPYYPKRFTVTPEEETYRNSIYAFKDGGGNPLFYEQIGKLVNKIIRLNFEENTEVYLCIIPASTTLKTIARFNKFCAEVVKKSNVINGYDLISNKLDRNPNHMIDGGGDADIIKYITRNDIRNKNIILVDDVITRGRSYDQISQELKKRGAKKIIGFFIGKTTHK